MKNPTAIALLLEAKYNQNKKDNFSSKILKAVALLMERKVNQNKKSSFHQKSKTYSLTFGETLTPRKEGHLFIKNPKAIALLLEAK